MGLLLLTSCFCLVSGLSCAVTFPTTTDDSPCVLLEQCCPLWQIWESRHIRVATSSSANILSSYICGWEGETPLYSCPGPHQPHPGEVFFLALPGYWRLFKDSWQTEELLIALSRVAIYEYK